jgi:DnaJ-class molecular chaperone
LPTAPLPVVQAAYRALAQLWHPDRNSGQGHAEMVAVNHAYEALQGDVHA